MFGYPFFPFAAISLFNTLSYIKVSMALAKALSSPLVTSMPVSPFGDTQFTPLPGMVKVTVGVPQYIASAKATPKASFFVTDGKAKTVAA